jgi:hypothetical protein
MLIKRQVMQCRVQAAGPRCRSLGALRRKQTRQLPVQLASRACLRGPPAAPQPWPVPSNGGSSGLGPIQADWGAFQADWEAALMMSTNSGFREAPPTCRGQQRRQQHAG